MGGINTPVYMFGRQLASHNPYIIRIKDANTYLPIDYYTEAPNYFRRRALWRDNMSLHFMPLLAHFVHCTALC